MRILYRQSTNSEKKGDFLSSYGINNCYFKSIRQTVGDRNHIKKRHSHNGFELHIMLDGSQCYETDGGRFFLEGGNVLAVPKRLPHSLVSSCYPITKYAFTFTLDNSCFDAESITDCYLFNIPERVISNILAFEELKKDAAFGSVFAENAVFESICLLLKEMGISYRKADDSVAVDPERTHLDERVELAVLFVRDNIENPLQVGEVASYCYISEKQLNRLFLQEMDISVAAYIRRERVKRIEELLTDSDLSLSAISERLGFPSEHGFNLFFKKNNGMPPGEYRKMTKNGK